MNRHWFGGYIQEKSLLERGFNCILIFSLFTNIPKWQIKTHMGTITEKYVILVYNVSLSSVTSINDDWIPWYQITPWHSSRILIMSVHVYILKDTRLFSQNVIHYAADLNQIMNKWIIEWDSSLIFLRYFLQKNILILILVKFQSWLWY